MQTPDLVLLYVKDTEKSTAFYRDLLKREPKAAFPTFVAFGLDGGFTLGLWSTKSVNLPFAESGSRFELAFQVDNEAAVEAMCADWRQRGTEIAQEPMTAVFGRTFVGLDPDGHRIRVCIADR
ncbi:MAG TPA: VOC family protein [Bryobacteraceae bacterium]|nr:VOC family protein [Bryobacteraceae bacterium]